MSRLLGAGVVIQTVARVRLECGHEEAPDESLRTRRAAFLPYEGPSSTGHKLSSERATH